MWDNRKKLTTELLLLKQLADIVFVVFSSFSICETNFRDYECKMERRKLRLKPELAEKPVFIYCNIKIKTWLFLYNFTRKPVVTGKKVILFVSIFWSQFLSHQKISVTTEDTAELIIKHVKHNVITTKSIKMALANLCTCRFV